MVLQMRRLRWVLQTIALVVGVRVHAQSMTAGVSRHAPQASTNAGRLTVTDTARGPTFLARFLAGIGGAGVGLIAGAYAGPAIFGTDCGGCDDPGLGQAVLGALVGTVTGAAVAAALPQVNSHCGFGGRFGHALIGSTIGGGVGALLSGGSAIILVTIPVGAAGGGATGAQAC